MTVSFPDCVELVTRSDHAKASSSFSFLRLLDISPNEAHSLHISPLIRRRLLAIQEESRIVEEAAYYMSAFI
jgi:DNA helicase INO80